MRLINGNHLEERVRKIVKDYAQAAKDSNITPGRVTFSSCGVIGLVESEPIVDAVPVVRCKDCLYWQKNSLFSGHMVCRYVVDCSVVRREDDFCSRGERKDGDQ